MKKDIFTILDFIIFHFFIFFVLNIWKEKEKQIEIHIMLWHF